MKKKLNREAGLTLIEMLAATAMVILLVMVLGVGMQMAVSNYQKRTAQSEAELLLSTALDALADDLRFARYVVPYTDAEGNFIDGDVPFIYTSDSFYGRIHLTLSAGQIMAMDIDSDDPDDPGKRLLPTGAYGIPVSDEYRAYQVTEMVIRSSYIDTVTNTLAYFETEPEEEPGTAPDTFTIYLEVQATADANITASGEITVRCLNDLNVKMTETTEINEITGIPEITEITTE